VAGSADADRAEEKLAGHALESSDSEEMHLHGGREWQSRRGDQNDHGHGHGNIAANTRPKALEDAAALSMVVVVVNQATTNSADAAKGEEQSTSNVKR
jgi:hypothetical protein